VSLTTHALTTDAFTTDAFTTHALNGCALKRCTGTAALGCGPWRSLRSRPLANVSTLLTDPGWLTWLANPGWPALGGRGVHGRGSWHQFPFVADRD